jgi:hypothetical protein
MGDPRPLPNTLVIGAMKASTTSFCAALARHPEVWFAAEKEPNYFCSREFGTAEAWNAYLDWFAECPRERKILAEGSTTYSKLPHFGNTPERIRAALGQPKLLYLLRDPVERTLSNFRHSWLRGHYPPRSRLADALEHDPILLDASCYHRQWSEYERVFGTGSVFIVIAEEFHLQPERVLGGVEPFLGLTPDGAWRRSMEPVNSNRQLEQSIAWHRVVPHAAWVRAVVKRTPAWIRRPLEAMVPRAAPPPAISEEEHLRAWSAIAGDLERLVERLGARIAHWPSVKRLATVR